jgi:hypothetical protein
LTFITQQKSPHMNAQDAQFEILEWGFPNITFRFLYNGFAGHFRCHYRDDTPRKNATYKTYVTQEIYFEGMPTGEGWGKSYRVASCTDAMLFLERHKQWVLETLTGLHEHAATAKLFFKS